MMTTTRTRPQTILTKRTKTSCRPRQSAEEQDHIQFMVNITFRVKMVAQVQKEKKKVVEVTHSGWDIYADYDSEGSL